MKGKVSMLNGGVDAWKKAGFEVTKDTPKVKEGKFKYAIDPVIVDRQYVAKSLTSPTTTVIDCRPTNVYNGDPVGYPRDGHIAGAKSLPYTEMFDANNTLKSDEDLQKYFTGIDASKGKELVTYCFIGQTASVVYLAGRELGYSMKLYDGSMQEWSRYKELPMEVTPKPAEPAK
jgi:thiosulfate/3-mercaptopyruvate sulfurtransferase